MLKEEFKSSNMKVRKKIEISILDISLLNDILIHQVMVVSKATLCC
jgi:hypothetical protein